MDKLLEILRSLNLDIDVETETGLIDKGILDSFDVVTLVAEIDRVFGVAVPPEELTAENFNSVQGLEALIRRLSSN